MRSALIAASLAATVLALETPGYVHAREWTDATGKYKVEADLVAVNETTAVLLKKDHELVSFALSDLSEADLEYLKSRETEAGADPFSEKKQKWTMKSGLEVIGSIVDYARKDVTIQRRRGRIYVNDRPFDNLPAIYRTMVPKIVGHFENTTLETDKDLQSWVIAQKGKARTFTCEGVILELENGDEYGVPFFFFSEDDLKVLQPGWERWTAVEKDEQEKEQERFRLESAAKAYQHDRMVQQEIAVMQLQLLAVATGATDLWEVRLLPSRAVGGPPLSVVVPAPDSRSASVLAAQKYPGYAVGPVRKASYRVQ
jgi:hypothetical protein